MRRIVMSLMVWAGLGLLVQAQELVWQAEGGGQLTIRAQAQEQRWLVWPERILVAAIVDGKLVVQEFSWPPGPNPPDPGPGPNPPPPPPPDPEPDPKPTQWQIAVVVETDQLDNLPPSQRSLLASLLVREELDRRGHRLVGILDPDSAPTASEPLKPWFAAAQGKTLPLLLRAPLEGGTIHVAPLPEDASALWKLLETPPTPSRGPTPRSSVRGTCRGPGCR